MKIDVYKTFGSIRFVLDIGEFNIPRFHHFDVGELYRIGRVYGKEKLQEDLIHGTWELCKDKCKFVFEIPSVPVHLKRLGKSSISFLIYIMAVERLVLELNRDDSEERYMGSYVFNSEFGIDLKSEYLKKDLLSFNKKYFEILWIFYNYPEFDFKI